MSIEKVRKYFEKYGKENQILEFALSSATVELAAKALNTDEAKICKTLSFKTADGCILICTAGDVRIDNKKFKTAFGIKAKMLTPEEVEKYTGHKIGGVCPFAIENVSVKVYCDVSLRRFDLIFPACGSSNSAIRLTPEELFEFSHSLSWVDISTKIIN